MLVEVSFDLASTSCKEFRSTVINKDWYWFLK